MAPTTPAIPDGLGDVGAEMGPDEVADGGHEQSDARRERSGGDRGRDGVRRVVETVGKIEDHRY
jgi:hypothetical protein